MQKGKLTQISLEKIAADSIQPRVETSMVAAKEYAERMEAGDKFPPIIVYLDEAAGMYYVGDGFARIEARKLNKGQMISALVRLPERKDMTAKIAALQCALGANHEHGLQRTNEDKHRAVNLALEQWPSYSSVFLAALCGVSRTFVDNLRAELHMPSDPLPPGATVAGEPEKHEPEKRVGSDGVARKLPPKKAPKKAEPKDDDDKAFTEAVKEAKAENKMDIVLEEIKILLKSFAKEERLHILEELQEWCE